MTKLIDDVDKKILSILDFNARISYTELGKKIGKTKQYARARIERLKEKNIILGPYVVIDVTRLGYNYIRLFIKLKNTKNEQEIIEYFKENKSTGWLVSSGGKYDIAAVIMTKNLIEYETLLDDFRKKFHKDLEITHTSIATKIWHLPYKIILNNSKKIIFGDTPTNKFDNKDLELLRELFKDGSANSVKLGEKVSLTPAAVITRLKKLEKEKIILAHRIKINTSILGYQKYKAFLKFHKVELIDEFIKYCDKNKNIIYVTKTLGDAPIEFEALCKNNKEFNLLARDIRNNFDIGLEFQEDYETHLVNYVPF